jgi:hypothetical protein
MLQIVIVTISLQIESIPDYGLCNRLQSPHEYFEWFRIMFRSPFSGAEGSPAYTKLQQVKFRSSTD